MTRRLSRPAHVIVMLVASAVALSGCATPEEVRQRDEAACSSYGFQPGTPDFAACLQREDLARRNSSWFTLGVSGGFGR
ncbi:MAG TPA: hypothetical protein VLV50_12845 [Stellaceae bacterium]|nr:hypothetical protein [Stellaceae bacterium]